MLTRESVLHYYDHRYGPVPIIGGAPHHTRNSDGAAMDERGVLYRPKINTPRGWWDFVPPVGVSGSERRPTMLLELARTNLVTGDFSSWTHTSVTATGSKSDPYGTATAFELNGTVNSGFSDRSITFTGNATKAVQVKLRKGTAAETQFGVFDTTAGVWRALVVVTWSAAGVPTVTSGGGGTGTIYPARALGDGWYIIEFQATGVIAANANILRLYPAGGATGTVFAYRPQAEDGVFPTSDIGFQAIRAADSFYWDSQYASQALIAYVRFVDRGSRDILGARVLNIGGTTDPRFLLYRDVGFYGVFYHAGTGVSGNATLAALPSLGDTVELVGVLDTSGTIFIYQSINGAAVTTATSATASAPTGASWSENRIWLNSIGAVEIGANAFADVKIVKRADIVATDAQGRMDELRSFELTPSGEVIS